MHISRRQFAASALTVYKLAGPKPVLMAAKPNDQVAMGFIGAGIRGSYLIESFKKTPGVKPLIVADLFDGHLDWAKETIPGVATTKDYHTVLARKDIDAVTVATPDHWHVRIVLDALAAGKHVYCEKPLTWSIDEGKAVIEAQKKTGKLVMVGSQGKTSPWIIKAKELINAGEIGKVSMVRMVNNRNSPDGAWVYPIPAMASPETIDWARFIGSSPKLPYDPKRFFRWRCWWEYSGGVATDLFVHLLTSMHEMMSVQAPVSAVAQGGLYKWTDGRTVPDVLSATFDYETFVAGMYVNLCNARGNGSVITVMGTEATMTFGNRGELMVEYEAPRPALESYGLNGWTRAMKQQHLESLGFADGKIPRNGEQKPAKEVKLERGLEHYELFIESIREGKPSRETAEEGHLAAGAAHLANMSYRRGKKMNWNRLTGRVSEA
jgi:predicted dehydrogenase